MTFVAQMRLGSLEILSVLAAFVLFAGRVRVHPPEDCGGIGPVRIELEVRWGAQARSVEGLCPMVVGRSNQADLILSDPEVSRRHARFECEKDVVYIADLHSSNGTFLNGERISESIEVLPGDVIDVGTTRLTFVRAARAPWPA